MRLRRFPVLVAGWATLALLQSVHAFDLQGHRGARGLAPENTIAAFGMALSIGVSTLEADLGLTSDGVLVLSHEPRLAAALTRGPDGKWLTEDGAPLVRLSYSDIERYDVGRLNPDHRYAAQFPQQKPADGERLPTLSALFELARDRRSPSGAPIRFNIETKVTPGAEVPTADAVTFAKAVVTAVRRAGMTERVTVQSFDWSTLVEVRRLAPELVTACLTIDSANMNTLRPGPDGASPWHAGLKLADYGNSLPRLARAAGCSTWSPFWRNVTEPVVTEAHGLGLRVVPWTLNEPTDMERMIDLGVDGLITDYPDRAQRVLAVKGVSID
jgi:glycerophosphoryl diester phosphodiesterase